MIDREARAARSTIESDLHQLLRDGKEAYLDALFARMDADEERMLRMMTRQVQSSGSAAVIRALEDSRETGLVRLAAALPRPCPGSHLVEKLAKTVRQANREVKRSLVMMSTAALIERHRSAMRMLIASHPITIQANQPDEPVSPPWWERLIGNTRLMRNLIVATISLSAFGVSAGLAVSGGTAEPLATTIGALVGLIALMQS